ncbi:unnamed protein product [Cylindrotheca closterium]|uniref:Uncharacterized protein n=1 Tax=Cylindrotheca closterium TaxID=2856 RepID=A0AAD2FQN3_9STRA|nr:unnamed protein product [Cylindrotheca closterium]
MFSLINFSKYLTVGVFMASQSKAMNPLEIKGYKFFDHLSGEEVVIKGIDYYPRPNDGLLNFNSLDYYSEEHRELWERDIAYFEELGVNAVRLYAVDPKKSHDSFMCALQEANIYVIVALARDCPTCAITRDQAPHCYPKELKEQGQAVIAAFAKYSNTLAFSAGNEVNHFAPPGMPQWNGVCQKKFLRDMRKYIASCPSLRKVPVGLIIADTDRAQNVLYYNCESDPKDKYENAEWLGLNSYVMCDGTAKRYDEALGLKALQKSFESYNYSIPVLMTEFGCLSDSFPEKEGYQGQRTFMQAKWLLNQPELLSLFAGAFGFEYSIEKANTGQESPYPFKCFGEQNYGIGFFEPENCNDIDIPCEYHPLPSFEFLKEAYNQSNGAPLTTVKTFSVPPERIGRSQCPEAFKPLSSFKWEADSAPSSWCPTKEDTNFVCTAHVASSGGCGFFDKLLRITFWGLILASAFFLTRKKPSDSDKKWAEKDDTFSEGSSNFSASLLNLTGIGKKYFNYQAIESDSSSDELGI